jgi:hypothetical protein
MKITLLVGSGLFAAGILGCTNFDPTLKGLLKIDVQDNNPSSPQMANSTILTPRTSAGAKEEGCTILPVRRSGFDVDTLYGRAMARFKFKSPEQIQLHRKLVDQTYFVDQGYKHEKQGGAFYHLAQTVASGVQGNSQTIWLELTFAKHGTGSDVTAEYCVDPKDPKASSASARQGIAARIEQMIGG